MKSTFLKVMAIICLVIGIVGALISIAGVAVTGFLSSGVSQAIAEAGVEVDETVAAVASGITGVVLLATVIMIIESIIMILAGVFGIKGSNNVAKVGGAVVMGVIMIILAVIGLISGIVSGGFNPLSLVDLIISLLYFLAAYMFKKKAA